MCSSGSCKTLILLAHDASTPRHRNYLSHGIHDQKVVGVPPGAALLPDEATGGETPRADAKDAAVRVKSEKVNGMKGTDGNAAKKNENGVGHTNAASAAKLGTPISSVSATLR